jgi:YD repeat-containing protein
MKLPQLFSLLTLGLGFALTAPAEAQVRLHAPTALSKLQLQPLHRSKVHSIGRTDAHRGTNTTVSRPGRAVSHSWNPISNRWDNAEVEMYLYDAQGRLTQETFADSASGAMLERSLYTYNAQGRNTSETYQEWTGAAWQNSGRYSTTYDASGNITSEIEESWYNGTWMMTDGLRYQNAYTNGLLTEQIQQEWRNGSYVNTQRLQFTVSNGQWSEIVVQTWSPGGQWQNEARIANLVWRNWSGTPAWTDVQLLQPTAYREFSWTGTTWELMQRSTVTYSLPATSVTLIETPTVTGGWRNRLRETESYDTYGNFLLFRSEKWRSNAWEIDYEDRDLLRYNANNDVVRRASQVYDAATSTAFVNLNLRTYSNFQTIVLGAKPAHALQAATNLYPNPTAGTATLSIANWRGQAPVRAEVLNGLGQIIQTLELRPQHGAIRQELSLHTLPAGLYTVRIQAPEGAYSQRLLKQ